MLDIVLAAGLRQFPLHAIECCISSLEDIFTEQDGVRESCNSLKLSGRTVKVKPPFRVGATRPPARIGYVYFPSGACVSLVKQGPSTKMQLTFDISPP